MDVLDRWFQGTWRLGGLLFTNQQTRHTVHKYLGNYNGSNSCLLIAVAD
jgi:hypothetical protein